MAEERLDLDRLSSLLSQHQKTVSGWLEQAPTTNNTSKKKSRSTQANVDFNVGRPPRLGIGAKPANQKAQLSDSIFVSQQLRMRMTGQEKLGNFNHVNLKAIGKPTKKEGAPVRKAAESDDEGRSRSLAVKAPSLASKGGKKKQRKK